MKQITTILLAGSAAIFMTACGGGSSSDLPIAPLIDTTPPVDTSPEVVDYGYASYNIFSSATKYYNVKGVDFYYDVEGCSYPSSGQYYYEAYDDNTITISFTLSNGSEETYNCPIEKKFVPILDPEDGDVNGSYIAYDLFYDNDTKINYLHDGYNPGYKLIEIINDGQSGVVKQTADSNTTTQVMLESVFEEVPLY